MQRYFVDKSSWTDSNIRITGDDAHHLLRVMRVRANDRIIVCDGEGRCVLAEVTELGKDAVNASIVEELAHSREPKLDVWLFQGLPKGDKLETVIQKCTEIGARRIVPFASARTVVQYDDRKEGKKLERWRKIAKEAAEQAHRSRIPAVDAPLTWKRMLQDAAAADVRLICYENERSTTLKQALRETLGASGGQALHAGKTTAVAVIVGPEGGLSDAEVQEAEAAGCRVVTLGARILRTETAPLVALAGIFYEYED